MFKTITTHVITGPLVPRQTSVAPPLGEGKKVDGTLLDHCLAGAFGVGGTAQVANMLYRQDIHYYGVATDAAYLKPYCESQSQGNWLKP